jgi:hypothetical protein
METPYTLTAAVTEATAAKPQQGRRALTFLVVSLLVQTLFGQAVNPGGQASAPNPDQLLIYGMLMRAHAMDAFEHIAANGKKTDAIHAQNKKESGLSDADLATFVRYGNQFYTAMMQMMAARGAAIKAKDATTARSTEAAFHTTWAAQINALKTELGPGAWGTLMAHKADWGGTVTEMKGGK